MAIRPLLLALGALLAPLTGRAQVVINEVSPSNYAELANSFGEYDDWMELYNITGTAVDLTGWYLSDNPNNTMKWAFPAGSTIAGNGHLVVFCSGRNTVAGGEYHTNFKLNQTDQEWAVLSDPAGAIISDFQLAIRTQADHSRGLDVDGTGTWRLFTNPTPGGSNTGAVDEYVAKPAFSVPAGVLGGPANVTITCATPGATIRYTTDGTTPTAGSPAYAGPVAIGTTSVLRARAFSGAGNSPPSAVETNTYLIGTTHSVAILSVAGDEIQTLMDGNQIEPVVSMEYFGPDGVLRDEATGDANEHGNDSWAYPQRGIDYISRDQFGDNDALHYPIFRTKDRDHYQRLIIKAAASDNYPFEGGGAHIRDAFVQALSQVNDLRLDERSYEPCVLYVNGQYWGVYEIREKVDDSDFTDEYYDQPEDQLYFLKTWGGTWQEYGGTAAQSEWDGLVAYILANDMGDPAAFAYVESLYNWRSLVDYVVLNSQVVCADWLNWNTAWWRGLNPDGDGRRWRYALWDMDATFGHYVNFTGIPDQSAAADPCNPESLPDPGGQGHVPVLDKLLNENDEVRTYYVNRFIDLNNTVFSCPYMIDLLDSLVALIEPEMPGHIARWGGNMAEWQGNVQAIRDFIDERCVQITTGLQDCYDVVGPHRVAYNVDPPLSGDITINSIQPPSYPFSGQYYGNIATTLAPLPGTGWVFSHWEVFSTNTVLPSTTDSLVTVDILAPDSIVAHFKPPTRYEIVLDAEPRGAASIQFDGVTYTELPTTVIVPANQQVPVQVLPEPYYDFTHWRVKNNPYTPEDSTSTALTCTLNGPDTIVACLKPQEYAFFAPNAFSPNGDGFNDVFQPFVNVLDLEQFELDIFDRWGHLLYSSVNPGMGWDGSSGGGDAPNGVYAFRARARDAILGTIHLLQGHVTLLR